MPDRERDADPIVKQNEARLRLALDAVGDGAWDWNLRTGEVHYSDRWIESLGYLRRDVPPSVSFWEGLIHPDDAARVRRELDRHFSGETSVFHCEYRILHGGGAYRHTLDRGRVIERDAGGVALRMVGTNCDVDDQALADHARRELARLQRSILDTASCVVVCLDLEYRILEFNAAAEALYGFSRAEVLGRNYLSTFLPEAARPRVAADIERVLAGAETRNFENRVLSRDGRDHLVSWNVTRLLGANGRAEGIVAIGEDKSERERALEQVRVLRGLLPICAGCKRVRSDLGYWTEIEEYLEANSEASVTHGICPECQATPAAGRGSAGAAPRAQGPRALRRGWDHLLLGPPPGRVLSADLVLRAMAQIRNNAALSAQIESASASEDFWRDFLCVYDALAVEGSGSAR